MNYQYYVVEGEGPVKLAINEYEEKRKLFNDHAKAVLERFNAKGMYLQNGSIAALTFDSNQPEGWLKVKKTSDGYRPPAKDKEACRFLHSVRGPSSFSLPASPVWAGDGRVYFPKFQQLGESLIWIIPEGAKFDSAGCRAIKTSEYYAMKGD